MDKAELDNMAASPPPYTNTPTYSSNPRPPPPSGYYQTPPHHMQPQAVPGYAPAPPVMQQQSSNNVVVVGQQPQSSLTREIHHVPSQYGSSYMVLTAVMMVLCFLHGNLPAFVCLIPALICSCAAIDHNSAGQYSSAKDCGSYALCCNIFSIVYYVLAMIAGTVVLIVYFTVGFGFITSAASDINNDINNIVPTQCYEHCDWTRCYYCNY